MEKLIGADDGCNRSKCYLMAMTKKPIFLPKMDGESFWRETTYVDR